MGNGRILLDPGVRVTYGFSQKWLMYSTFFNESELTGIKVSHICGCAPACRLKQAADCPSRLTVRLHSLSLAGVRAGLQPTTWADLQAAAPVNWTAEESKPALDQVECCDMLPEHDLIADW